MFKSIFLPIAGVMILIVVVGLIYQGKIPLNKLNDNNQEVKSKTIVINDKEIAIEIAKTSQERAKGLSNRESLDKDSGMLFVFDNERPTFWMKDTLIPLDIIWINDGLIIKIDENVQPEPNTADSNLKRYQAPDITDYVLEVNAGFSKENNIKVGDSVNKLSDL